MQKTRHVIQNGTWLCAYGHVRHKGHIYIYTHTHSFHFLSNCLFILFRHFHGSLAQHMAVSMPAALKGMNLSLIVGRIWAKECRAADSPGENWSAGAAGRDRPHVAVVSTDLMGPLRLTYLQRQGNSHFGDLLNGLPCLIPWGLISRYAEKGRLRHRTDAGCKHLEMHMRGLAKKLETSIPTGHQQPPRPQPCHHSTQELTCRPDCRPTAAEDTNAQTKFAAIHQSVPALIVHPNIR